MSYSGILKSTIGLNTASIFEKNTLVALDQNISRTDDFKFLNSNRFQISYFLLLRTRTEPEPDNSKYFKFLTATPAKSNDEKPEPEVNR